MRFIACSIDFNEKMTKHLKVKVYTDQAEEKIVENTDNSYDLYIREPAKEGMANRRVLAILMDKVNPKPKRLKIVSGHISPAKIIEVE